jgi:hypothetical protein
MIIASKGNICLARWLMLAKVSRSTETGEARLQTQVVRYLTGTPHREGELGQRCHPER